MKLSFNASPNLRQKQSTNQIMLELLIGLFVVFGFQVAYYFTQVSSELAIHAITLMVSAIIASIATEFVWCLARKEKFTKFIKSSFPLITAVILVLMCPANTSVYAIIIGTVFAILIGKLIFGGFGHNIFNPAAVGRAVILASFTGAVVQIADAYTSATVTTQVASQFGWLVTNSSEVVTNMFETYSMSTLFTGQYLGAMGETNTLVILLVGLVLAIRKVIDWRVPVVYMGSVFLFTTGVALINGVPSVDAYGIFWYPLVHLATGGIAFAAIFMLTDPVTSPTSATGRIIFSIGAAFFTVLIRLFGNYPEGVLFSILIMNMLTPMIERLVDGQQRKNLKKSYLATAIVLLVSGATIIGSSLTLERVEAEEEPVVDTTLSFEDVKDIDASILSVEDLDGTNTVYTVEAVGYSGAMNKFEITVDTTTNTITGYVNTVNNDTEYVGDKIQADSFTEVIVGKVVDDSFEVDSIAGATISTKSAVRAIMEVNNELLRAAE